MKKEKFDGRGAEECKSIDWVEMSINTQDSGSDAIVNETISQIVSEEYLKVDTSDMDGVREAVDSFYAYEKKKPSAKKRANTNPPADDPEQAIRRSVDEKIIIRSEELKHKRKSASSAASKGRKPKRPLPPPRSDSFRHAKGLDKYRKMGILPTKKNGPSDFRKKSADWKYDDVKKAAVTDEAIEQEEAMETFADRLKKYTPVQWICVAMAAVIVITSVMTTTVYADYRGELNKALAMSTLPSFTDDASLIAYNEDSVLTEEVQMEDAASELQATEGKMLSLVLTSVEKDLKVKLVDDEDTLVKGVRWGITVTDDKDKESSYEDEDEDGIIHLTGISAGDYSVAITDSEALAGYVYPTVGQKVSVKAKVEYKVIANIKDEIKKESEVNAAAEDNGNKAADVETGTAPKDTVEFVESTAVENGETYEEATVDLTKTEVIASAADRLFGALNNIAGSVKGSFSSTNIAALRMMPRLVATEDTTPTPDHEHSFVESSVEPATCTKEGKRVLKCDHEGCDETRTESIPSRGHSYKKTITKEATCTEKGEATYECDCGDKYTESIDALGHDYVNGKCKRCGQSDPNNTPTPTPTPDASLVVLDETPTPTPTPTPSTEYKPEAQLYDSAKNPLYVFENDAYRLAKFADYDSKKFDKFYRKVVGFIYTGWQNIDGKSYYYTKDHEKVTGDQIIGGVSYSFNSDGSLDNGSGVLGIDVSKYQPSINWSSVKASGVDFVIIRCGYRGASTGALIQDPYFTRHMKGAKSAGLKVGVYFFSTALNEAEAVEEASMCAALCGDYGINYPVFLDVESSSRPGYNTLSASQRTENIKAFCKTISSAGYTPGLYANKTWLSEKINTSSLSCKIWLAQYRAEGPTYSGRYDIWQYTSKGRVDGISGNVDMNKSFLRY